MPGLTVLLPVHDGAPYLRAALRSTLAALPSDGRLLVIDDASADESPQIASEFAASDRRVQIHRREESTGLPDALNDGIARVRTPLLARMDADDVCLPTRFRRQIRLLRRVDFVFGSSILIDERSRPIGFSTPWPIRPPAAWAHLLVGNFFSHPTMACRTDAVRALGGYRRTTVEDYDLWLRAAAAGFRMQQSPLPAIAYRRHRHQVTSTWRLAAEEPMLDAAYRGIAPDSLTDVIAVLRHSATRRQRAGATEREAWRRLRRELESAAGGLGPVDRLVLLRRLAGQEPR